MYLIDVLEDMSKNHPALDVIRETWEKHWKSIMQSLYYTMYNGLPFDMEGAKKLKQKNEERINEINELIENNSFIKGTEKKLQGIALEKAWKEYNKKVDLAISKGKVFKGKEPTIENGKYGSTDLCPKFKTTSTAHKKVLFNKLGLLHLNLPLVFKGLNVLLNLPSISFSTISIQGKI